MSRATIPGLIVSAPRSGAGKTTVMLGLLRCLAEDGVKVRPYKCGPDYIDPAFHRAACGEASRNLDSWAMGPGVLADQLGLPGEMALAEGSMGLFDGVARAGASGNGSTADIAAITGWPVVVVMDVSGHAQTVAALAAGLRQFRPDVRVAGVILNRVASPRHERLCRLALDDAGIPVFGALPRRGDLTLPERHLGLVQAVEHPDLQSAIAAYAAFLRAMSILRRCAHWRRAAGLCSPPVASAPRRSGSPWRRTRHFPSPIRICSPRGGQPGRRSSPFPLWQTSPHRMPTAAGFPAATRNSMQDDWPRRRTFLRA